MPDDLSSLLSGGNQMGLLQLLAAGQPQRTPGMPGGGLLSGPTQLPSPPGPPMPTNVGQGAAPPGAMLPPGAPAGPSGIAPPMPPGPGPAQPPMPGTFGPQVASAPGTALNPVLAMLLRRLLQNGGQSQQPQGGGQGQMDPAAIMRARMMGMF